MFERGFLDCRDERVNYFTAAGWVPSTRSTLLNDWGCRVRLCRGVLPIIRKSTRRREPWSSNSPVGSVMTTRRLGMCKQRGQATWSWCSSGCLRRLVGREGDTSQEILAGISDKCAVEGLSMRVQYLEPKDFMVLPRSRRILPGLRNEDVKDLILIYPFQEYAVANLMWKFPLFRFWRITIMPKSIVCLSTRSAGSPG